MPSALDSIYNGKDLLIINNKEEYLYEDVLYLEIDGEIIKDEVEEND